MNKIKYLFNRIINMNFSNFFKTINYLHKRTNKSRIVLFFDIIYCGFVYQAGYMDYKLFEMYNMNKEQRQTIITRGINNNFIKTMNNPEHYKIFNNKLLFNKTFDDYLNREWMELSNTNYDEFLKFVKRHEEIIVKPTNGQCGKGIEKIKVNFKNSKDTFDSLLANGQILIEEVATQVNEINKLHPYSINTLRVVTINYKVVTAYIRIGTGKQVVDNFNSGGITTVIDIENGKLNFPAIDKSDNLFEEHPLTKEKIVGISIPNWKEIVKYVETLSRKIPDVKYVGWDICVSDNGPMLIEGNEFPGHDIYQLPPHRKDNIGLLPVFEKALKGE